ncbi:MAG TPA: phage tail tube protein [Vicinamibacterales bacterium]|nr:phage tail tube protein [Vicinamibacterales bacterium]
MPVYQLGRVGTVFVAAEAAYGTAPGLAATDAIRHLNVNLGYNPRNRVDAPVRHGHPSLVYRRTRRTTGQWSLRGEFYPSGTLNTLPDHDEILEHGLGTKTNRALATTVASVPTTTGATVASAGALASGDAVLITIASGGSAGKYVRFLTNVAGAALTWAPALPAAPAVGDAVKGCITYSLATALAKSLNIGHYLTSLSYQGYGAVVDQLKIQFDANNEVMWEASGPMQRRTRPAATAQPGAFTTVGATPPSGLTGGQYISGTAVDYIKAEVTIANAMDLDNFAGGTSQARGFFRRGKRKVEVNLNTMVSDDTTLIAAAEGTTDQTVLVQSGDTEGSIVAVYCPLVEFDVPDDPDDDETMEFSFKGSAKGSIAGNDELRIAVA